MIVKKLITGTVGEICILFRIVILYKQGLSLMLHRLELGLRKDCFAKTNNSFPQMSAEN